MTTVRTEKKLDRLKSVIRQKDMDKDLFNQIEKLAKECIDSPKERFKDDNEIANYIKNNLESNQKEKDYCWHVIVGRNFGGCFTYKEKVMAYFYVAQTGFLVFATSEV